MMIFFTGLTTLSLHAAWYWPFGRSENEREKRLSELLEPASRLIDEASDFSEDGKVDEAVGSYRKALLELERVELEYPDRAASKEFASLRNKRAYINAAIDSLLLAQARKNVNAVTVTDTTELEHKYRQEKEAEKAPKVAEKSEATDQAVRRERLKKASEALSKGNTVEAHQILKEILETRPNDAAALNLRAAVEASEGDYDTAQATLEQSIRSNPKSYYAYYNLAKLILQTRGTAGYATAKRYYETGRACGGPMDKKLEEALW